MLKYFTRVFLSFLLSLVSLSASASVSVPFEMTEDLYNDASVVVNKEGDSFWGHPELDGAGLLGICLGKMAVTINFDWSDKYVDIAFSGVPDRLSFSCESAALTTGIYFYVKESPDGTNWSGEIWSDEGNRMPTCDIELSQSTRYVRLCYSGNYDACFSDVTITAKYRLKVVSNGVTLRDEYLSAGTALSVSNPTNVPGCCHFVGWDKEIPSTMPKEDLTINANFEVNQYTSYFTLSDASQGIELEGYSKTFDCGKVVEVETPTYTGFTFSGWSPSLPETVSSDMDGETYVAQWTRNKYRYVVYTTEEDSTVQGIDYQTALTPLTEPSRVGFIFEGWDKEQPSAMPAENLTIKALWKAIDYKLTVYTTDEEYTETIKHYGDVLSPLTDPVREGYTFTGWDVEMPATMPASDVTIHANWDVNTYRFVVYTSEQDSTVRQLSYGDDIPSSYVKKPSKTGYKFLGWDVDVPDAMPAHDVVLKAQWEAILYTFILNVDGETYFQKSFTYGETIDMSDYTDPTKKGYVFNGWGVDELPTIMPDYNLSYEAQWTAADYNLIVVKNETDQTQNDTIGYAYGDKLKAIAEPTRVGYTFQGWDIELPEYMPNNDVIVTALWNINDYRYVVYTTETDSTVDLLHYGDALTTLSEPSRVGYQFLGWDREQPTTMPAADLTIRALWSMNAYRYVVYTSDIDSTVTLKNYGDVLEDLPTPVLTGYDFQGWDREQPATMPAEDFVIRAVWEKAKFELVLQKGLDFDPASDVLYVEYQGEVKVDEPMHEGYTFEGWNPVLPATMPAENVVTTAVWSKNKYRYVVYFSDNDSLVENVYYGEPLDALSEQTMEGYLFQGWDVEQPATMPAYDLTIHALWKVRNYTVTLYYDAENIYMQQEIAYGSDFVLEDYKDPTHAGYTFIGWDSEFPATMPAKELSFEAQWQAQTFSIIVVNDAENPALNDTLSYECDEKVAKLDEPEKTGYTFTGWSEEVPSVMPSHNVIITALWSANTYTLSFYSEDVLLTSVEYKYKETIDYKSVEKPKNEGYAFLGWKNAPEVMPAEDTRLDAVWSANAYSIVVVYDASDLLKNDTLYYEYGQTIQPLSDPEKYGYQFLGWSQNLPATMPAENLIVEAQWTIGVYTLTTLVNCKPVSYTYSFGDEVILENPDELGYQFNGWSQEVPSTMPGNNLLLIADMSLLKYNFITIVDDLSDTVVYHYTDVVETPTSPEKEGFTFEKWNPEVPETMPAQEVSVKAQWRRNTYSVIYLSEEDTLQVDSLLYEQPIEKPADPEREGCTFLGWNEELPATMPAADLSFMAEWKTNTYELTIITEDTITEKYLFGASLDALDTPIRSGYTFVKWNKELPETMPSHNDTIIALWSKNEYTITWMLENGETPIVEAYFYGDTVKVAEDPVRKGYEFLGWDSDVPATMPATSLEVYAEWSAIDYLLTFVVQEKTETYKYKYGETIEIPTDPQVEGYTFTGWDPEIPETMPDSSMTLNAELTANVYHLIATLDGEVLEDREYEYNEKVMALEIPQKTGWEFEEWIPSVPESMPANDVTVEASLKQLYYSFVKVVDEDTVSYTLTYGESLPEITSPEKKGYTFVEWSKEIPETMSDENDTIVALWQANLYELTLVITEDSVSKQMIAYGDTVVLADEPVRKGYRFMGWNDAFPDYMPAYDVTLEAKWEKNEFQIVYVSEGDTLATDVYETGDTIRSRWLTREGWTFEGWTPELPELMDNQDWTVEAVWNINAYTISIVVGTDTTTRIYNFNAKVTQPSDPKVEGYTFVAWSDTFPAYMPAEDLTIEAELKKNVHAFVVDVDGETDTVFYEYGDKVEEPSTPVKNGYVFIGWSDDYPETMPDYDVVITALWENSYYNLNLVIDGDTITNHYMFGDEVAKFPNPGIAGGVFVRWSEPIPIIMPDSDVTINAIFEMKSYELTLIDSLSEKMVTVYSIPCRDSIRLEVPEHDGYSFVEWDGELPEIMPDYNLMVTAVWKLNQHHFVVMVDEQEVVDTLYNYGDTVIAPATPEVTEGYSFVEWDREVPETMPDEDVTIKALINVNTYTLTFVSEGDTLSHFTYAYGVKIDSTKITAIEPTRAGFTFEGWSQEIPQKMPARNIIFSALWTAKGYAITYIVEGDTTVERYDCGAAILPFEVTEKEGYRFVGWSSSLPDTMPAKDLTVEAEFEKETYDFTYVTNKKTTTISYAYGDDVEMPEEPSRKGYTFICWSDEIPETMPAHDVKVSAVWEANTYELTLVSDGKVVRKTMVAFGDSLGLPTNIVKSGYLFKGWNEYVPETMPAQDITLTAKFKATGELIVYTEDKTLYITGLDDNAEAIVLDEIGRLVYRGYNREIELMKYGVYIVRARHQTKKIIVK